MQGKTLGAEDVLNLMQTDVFSLESVELRCSPGHYTNQQCDTPYSQASNYFA